MTLFSQPLYFLYKSVAEKLHPAQEHTKPPLAAPLDMTSLPSVYSGRCACSLWFV